MKKCGSSLSLSASIQGGSQSCRRGPARVQGWPRSHPEAVGTFAVFSFSVRAKVVTSRARGSGRFVAWFGAGGAWPWSGKLPVAVRPVGLTGACGGNSAHELRVRAGERWWGFSWARSLERGDLWVEALREPHPRLFFCLC